MRPRARSHHAMLASFRHYKGRNWLNTTSPMIMRIHIVDCAPPRRTGSPLTFKCFICSSSLASAALIGTPSQLCCSPPRRQPADGRSRRRRPSSLSDSDVSDQYRSATPLHYQTGDRAPCKPRASYFSKYWFYAPRKQCRPAIDC